MDRLTDPGPQLASLASEVEEIRARLESSPIGAPQAKQIIDAIQNLADRLPASAAVDLAPFHELARRIEAVRSTMDRQTDPGPQLASLASEVEEIRARLESSPIGAPQAKQIIDAIQNLADRPPASAAVDLAPFHELARRVEAVRSTMDRQTDPGPQLASLASQVEEIRARLENSQIGAPQAKQIIDAIQNLADRPPASAAVDLAPFHELARRVDAVRPPSKSAPFSPAIRAASKPSSPSWTTNSANLCAPRMEWLTRICSASLRGSRTSHVQGFRGLGRFRRACAISPRSSTACAPPLRSAAVSRAKRRPSKQSLPRWATNSRIRCAPRRKTKPSTRICGSSWLGSRGSRASRGRGIGRPRRPARPRR